jgi:hypothetical protein
MKKFGGEPRLKRQLFFERENLEIIVSTCDLI